MGKLLASFIQQGVSSKEIIYLQLCLFSQQKKIIEVLANYQHTSGQLINKAKSSYYMHANVARDLVNTVGTITGFSKGEFPFSYLGCPIFYTRRRKEYYNDLIKMVKGKLHSWKGKLLSYGGKSALISSVLENHIRQEVHFANTDDYRDTPRWIPTSSYRFTVHQVIRAWWNAKCFPKLKPLFQDTPAVIIWEPWKRRNTMKHGGVVSCNRVIHEVNKTLYSLTRLPHEGWFKCNTDGASRGNPGPSSYGFCVQYQDGNLVFAKAKEIGEATNIVAEAKAIMEGLSFCVERQLYPLIMETDSLVMSKIINDEWETPWCIRAEVRKIKKINSTYNVLFQHVLREGNTVANILANLVFSFASTITFHSFHELPIEIKTLINMDKSQIPNLSIRIAKRKDPD
ncbi:uncharacterized protein [Nicotiana tomentosiformis]|uniref:uncharacterized protein n=1 Tax=Nicotiana tomentosiformis TaxID=4098 RepID=UPI00388CA645